MKARHRFGIRVKLLSFYVVAMLAVVVLDLVVQAVSYRAVKEFEVRLSRYYDVHRLRLGLALHHARMDRMLREGAVPEEYRLDQDLDDFHFSLGILEGAESESLNAFFNLQASRRGIDAYFLRIAAAASRRADADREWFQDMAAAGRIAAYVDEYLSLLLSEALKAGGERYQALISHLRSVRTLTLGGLAGFAVLFGMAAWAFSASVAAPISRLAAASQRIAAGDLDVEAVSAPTGDEVEVLARSFNTMSLSIKSMVQDLRGKADLERRLREEERELMDKERALREAQFSSLQDQIRPHFLFNALNTIARTALFEKAEETERLALALGRLFRYSLGSPEVLVSLKDELSIVEEYLKFQGLRFGDRLRWTIHAQNSALGAPIPRFTLQPFVENAVRHGIEPLESGGSVEIKVRKKSGRLYLSVQDTGVGTECLTEGLGVSNVRRRLELRYGGEARFSIRSGRGSGTLVRISLPAGERGPA